MTFAEALNHIRNALNPEHSSQKGSRGNALVPREALREFYRGWESIDMKARQLHEMVSRPSILYKVKVHIDGNKWCALYGDNLQDGVAGFGDTPQEAMDDFDRNWNNQKAGGKELGEG